MKKYILLTGATGFLGSHLLKKLTEEGYNVVIIIRETSNTEKIKNLSGFSVFILNKQFTNIKKLFETYEIETIIHVATEYGRNLSYSSVLEANVIFPIKLIEAADKVNLFINTDSFFSKSQDYMYLQEYIYSKKIFKDYLKSLPNLQVCTLQLEHIYGEFDSDSKVVTSLIKRMVKNEEKIELTNGTQKRDFIYVSDVVEAYMVALNKKDKLNKYTEFEVGTGTSVSLRDFVYKIHQISNSKSDLLFGVLPDRINEITDSTANNLKLFDLGWKPKYTVETALERILKLEKI